MNIPISNTLRSILIDLKTSGFRGFLVGGCVRDAIMGFVPKDIDVEVYGMNYNFLFDFLKKYDKDNRPNIVGQSFGVIKIRDIEGRDYDFSLPRRESCSGVTHKDFQTEFDPNISPQEAASRRDFTINAISYDPLEDKIYDFFNGIRDIENKQLTAVSYHFGEDPLRVFRGMQFAARFRFDIDEQTASICRKIINSIYERDVLTNELKMTTVMVDGMEKLVLPIERIAEEWNKFFLKASYPEVLIDYLIKTGMMEIYPEIGNVLEIEQDPYYHPEGNVGNHIIQCLRNTIEIITRENFNENDRIVMILAVLTHDLGKVSCTERKIKDGRNAITSAGHDMIGVPLARKFMEKVGVNIEIINQVLPLVGNHMILASSGYSKDSAGRNILQIAEKVIPTNIRMLSLLIEIDRISRIGKTPKGVYLKEILDFRQDAQEWGVYEQPLVNYFEKAAGRIADIFRNPMDRIFTSQIVRAIRYEQLKGKFSKIHNDEEAFEFARIKAAEKVVSRMIDIKEDVIKPFGLQPSPIIGQIKEGLKKAYLDGTINTKEEAIHWIENNFKLKRI